MKNCRRWRRRAANLTGDFKTKKGWLESHFWHAKRCKMIEYWGFKVAAHLNEKCLKSTFRSSRKGALLHDFSYWQPFWIESFDKEKFSSIYGDENILDITIEHKGIQLYPIKIFTATFTRPVMLIHPAAIQTKLFENEGIDYFLNCYSIVLKPASEDMCTFKLHGPRSESVICQLVGIPEIKSFPLKVKFADPRSSTKKAVLISDIENAFLDTKTIKSDYKINLEKSSILITDAENSSSEMATIAVTKKNSEYFVSCPKKWARIVWYQMTRIKPIKVAGIEQVDSISLENDIPVYPRDFVASPAYEIWANTEKIRLEAIYNKKPPAKRTSYEKFGITSPFKPNFQGLGSLTKVVVEIGGRGIISEFAEIYDTNRILIGHATSATPSSLKKGCSTAIASISKNQISDTNVLVRNFTSPDIFRNGKIISIL